MHEVLLYMKFRNIGRYIVNLDHVVYIDTIVPNKLYLKMNDGINLEFDGTLEEFLLDTAILQNRFDFALWGDEDGRNRSD